MKKSTLAPEFKVTKPHPFGLKHMVEEEEAPSVKKCVTMQVTPIADLANIAPMESAHCAKKAWRPKGRK